MIAVYVPLLRPAVLDRARALLSALGPAAAVVSPHPAPAYSRTRWHRLPDLETSSVRAWVAAHRPALVVVDGPGTHARAVIGSGPAVAVVAQLEVEVDAELGAAYTEADLILAPWAVGSVEGWPARWQERTLHLGAVGWQAAASARRRLVGGSDSSHRWECVVLSATGAGPGPRERRAMMTGTPGWRWTYAPEHAVLEEGPVWDALLRCSVVVCTPTPTNLAAVAAARKPAVLVASGRSHGQHFLAEAARRSAPVLVRDSWPSPDGWGVVLDEARRLDPRGWQSWAPEPGLTALMEVARGTSAPTSGAAHLPGADSPRAPVAAQA